MGHANCCKRPCSQLVVVISLGTIFSSHRRCNMLQSNSLISLSSVNMMLQDNQQGFGLNYDKATPSLKNVQLLRQRKCSSAGSDSLCGIHIQADNVTVRPETSTHVTYAWCNFSSGAKRSRHSNAGGTWVSKEDTGTARWQSEGRPLMLRPELGSAETRRNSCARLLKPSSPLNHAAFNLLGNIPKALASGFSRCSTEQPQSEHQWHAMKGQHDGRLTDGQC
jgi:hypothetical protein